MAGFLGDVEEVHSTDTSSEERLVSVSPRCVHQKTALVLANSLGKGLGALLNDDVAPALLARLADIELGTLRGVESGGKDLLLQLGLANLALDAATVDGNVTKVSKETLSAVLRANKVEELRSIINEGSPACTIDEGRVCKQRCQEWDVGLDTADSELNESAEHLSAGDLVGRTLTGHLGQETVKRTLVTIFGEVE
jgi:hypothetical protein